MPTFEPLMLRNICAENHLLIFILPFNVSSQKRWIQLTHFDRNRYVIWYSNIYINNRHQKILEFYMPHNLFFESLKFQKSQINPFATSSVKLD